MNFREELSWTLDKKGKTINSETEYKQNIDFVHSLGKKSDCVGWSTLKMDEADADNVLDEIKKFCKTNGWRARGWYKRTYLDVKSDWFELLTSDFKDATIADITNVPANNGREIELATIRAYHELNPSPKEWLGICVPERFRNACIKNGVEGVEFYWVHDKGKYAAEQYFYIYPDRLIPRVACDKGLKKSDKLKIKALGGYLPKIADIFYELQAIDLPDCYLEEDMPGGGIAYVYCPSTNSFCGRDKILIHKDTAEILVSEKALSWKDLKTVPILDSCLKGYTLDKTQEKLKPSSTYIYQSLTEYEKLKKKDRPIRVIGEKDALKVFRKAKSERKEDFRKQINKNTIEQIKESEYKLLLPFYQIANGGQLCDEYELLSYQESVVATVEFFEELEREELLEKRPQGIVFSKCTDGDAVLADRDGKVVRFSHETPEIIDEWNSISQFFFDAITEYE